MRMLRWVSANLFIDKIRNTRIHKKLEVPPNENKIQEPIEMVYACSSKAYMCTN